MSWQKPSKISILHWFRQVRFIFQPFQMRIICVLNYNRAFIVQFTYKHWGYNTTQIRIMSRITPCAYITIFLDAPASICEEIRYIHYYTHVYYLTSFCSKNKMAESRRKEVLESSVCFYELIFYEFVFRQKWSSILLSNWSFGYFFLSN